MTTMALSFTEQRNIERQNKKAAVEKRRKQYEQALMHGYVSETKLGSSMISSALIKSISQYIGKNVQGDVLMKQSKKLSDVVKDSLVALTVDMSKGKVDGGEFPLAAAIASRALKAVLDAVTQQSGEQVVIADDVVVYECSQTPKVIEAIAAAAEYELKMLKVYDVNADAYFACKRIVNEPAFAGEMETIALQGVLKGWSVSGALDAWKQWKAGAQDTAFELVAKEGAVEWTPWTMDEVVAIGGFLQTAMDVCATGTEHKFWDTVDYIADVKSECAKYFVLSDVVAFTEAQQKEIESARSKPVMRTLPIKWMDGVYGGQADNMETKTDAFIRKAQPGSSVGAVVYAAVNNVQSVPYVVNTFMLDVAKQLVDTLEKGSHKIGSFIAPVKGVHISKSLRTKAAIDAAQAEVDAGGPFWSYWNVDYRGRMYAINTTLHVQTTDFEKSLLKVADAQPVTADNWDTTKYWLSVHLANTFGKDKLSFKGRVQWVEDNIGDILSVAQSPIEWMTYWSSGKDDGFVPDKPWQFMAACEEYVALFVDCSRTETSLLVATDCTCSGIQVLSGITRDANAAKLVNVIGDDSVDAVPQDAYGSVAALAAQLLTGEVEGHGLTSAQKKKIAGKAEWVGLLDRKLCKKVVMTMPYNSTPSKHGEEIKKALKGKDLPVGLDDRKALLAALGIAIRWSVTQLLPQVMQFKAWINECAANYADANGSLSWTTPSGFKVVQVKNVIESVELRTSFGGERGKVTMAIAETDEVAASKHGTCTMPNFVHSLDASLLHMAFAGFDKPFALIHDSVMTTAADMDKAIAAYKASYVLHFGEGSQVLSDMVEMLSDYAAKQVTPEFGDLVVEEVKNSMYLLA